MKRSIGTGGKTKNGWSNCFHPERLIPSAESCKSAFLSDIPTLIANRDHLQQGVSVLAKMDKRMSIIIDQLDDIPLRARPPGFKGLAEIVVGQQVSKTAASAIFGRLTNLISPFEPEVFINAGEAPLIEAGLSRAKQITLTGLADAIVAKRLDLQDICNRPADEAIATLCQMKGIGPWTAEVFLLFCAGHPDVFPAGDVALQHACGWVHDHPEKPDAKQTRKLADRWAPLRGVAARVLYAHYGQVRKLSEIPV